MEWGVCVCAASRGWTRGGLTPQAAAQREPHTTSHTQRATQHESHTTGRTPRAAHRFGAARGPERPQRRAHARQSTAQSKDRTHTQRHHGQHVQQGLAEGRHGQWVQRELVGAHGEPTCTPTRRSQPPVCRPGSNGSGAREPSRATGAMAFPTLAMIRVTVRVRSCVQHDTAARHGAAGMRVGAALRAASHEAASGGVSTTESACHVCVWGGGGWGVRLLSRAMQPPTPAPLTAGHRVQRKHPPPAGLRWLRGTGAPRAHTPRVTPRYHSARAQRHAQPTPAASPKLGCGARLGPPAGRCRG